LSYFFIAESGDIRGQKIIDTSLTITTSSPIIEPEFALQTHVIGEGDTFGIATDALGIEYGKMLEILDRASSTYDFTRVKVGQPLTLAKNKGGERVYLDYERDRDSIVRFYFADARAEIIPIEYEVTEVSISGTVSSSLYLDALALGIPDAVIMQFADMFAWTIDFSTQVQSSDSFFFDI
jgi:hypothetical protein